MSCLKDNEHLAVKECLLTLHVKHSCGTGHAYLVRFLVPDESKLADQLNADLAMLVHMMQERAHHGILEVNGHKYHATEVTWGLDPAFSMLAQEMPALVMRPKLQATPVAELAETAPAYREEAEHVATHHEEPPAPDYLNLAPQAPVDTSEEAAKPENKRRKR